MSKKQEAIAKEEYLKKLTFEEEEYEKEAHYN